MIYLKAHGFGLEGLSMLSEARTRSISAENPTGRKAGGARVEPDPSSASSMLGRGWKVRPCISLEPHSTVTLADIEGPGILQHIWITVRASAYRSTVLRFYWDGEPNPSVETPLGANSGNGHGPRYNVCSLPVAVNPSGGFNCYWSMPFRERARVKSGTRVQMLSPDSSTRSPTACSPCHNALPTSTHSGDGQ